MTHSDIESALGKIVAERQKALSEARAIIRRSDRDELLFLLIHQNHLMRVIRVVRADEMDSAVKALCSVAEDAYAYAIQLAHKYGRSGSGVAFRDYYRLMEISRFINNGFEMETMLRHFPFQRSGERLQHFKIYLDAMKAGNERSRLYEYAARHEVDGALRQAAWMTVDNLILELFPPSMDPEFLEVFGLTTQEVRDFYSALLAEAAKRLTEAEQLMPRVRPDRIDVTRVESFQAARFAYTVDYEGFLNQFGSRKQRFRKFLLYQTLKRDEIDERELRHFAIWRHSLLRLDRRYFTFSPEITTFSPNIGLHYALLEDARTKDAYQAKKAMQFQGRVESSLVASGIRIIAKNVEAKRGKHDIGDIDILAEDEHYYFNVECKGATLPLRVYFHDFDYIWDVHLPHLRDVKGWEKKVVAREQWLREKRGELGLTEDKPLTSLIVSDSPEVLSHYCNTLCLSLHEFPLWYAAVRAEKKLIGFDEFFRDVLKKRMAIPTEASRDDVYAYTGLRFERDSS
jgi:hypothetical protein